jgi:hypothetical protein
VGCSQLGDAGEPFLGLDVHLGTEEVLGIPLLQGLGSLHNDFGFSNNISPETSVHSGSANKHGAQVLDFDRCARWRCALVGCPAPPKVSGVFLSADQLSALMTYRHGAEYVPACNKHFHTR